jgi:hypothetical protein
MPALQSLLDAVAGVFPTPVNPGKFGNTAIRGAVSAGGIRMDTGAGIAEGGGGGNNLGSSTNLSSNNLSSNTQIHLSRVSNESESHPSSFAENKHFGHPFMDVSIDDQPQGRIVFDLFDDVPKTAENFLELSTGEKGESDIYDSYKLFPSNYLPGRKVRMTFMIPRTIHRGER